MKKKDKASYRQFRWKLFRDQILEANNFQCSYCNRHQTDGVIFQVHHKCYKTDENGQLRNPWEYPLSDFEVLCQGCHARKHGRIPPADGWQEIDCEDMMEPCVECEYPNCTYDGLLRYVHTIYHPNWGFLNVGCNHAARLTGMDEASLKKIENEEEKKQRMFDTFCNKEKWEQVDNRYSRDYCDFPITITAVKDYFLLIIFIQLPDKYDTVEKAQQAAFAICYNNYPKHFCEQYQLPYQELKAKKPHSKTNPLIYRNQLTYAINNKTGKLVHIDSVKQGVLCNCICPACGKPLIADNTPIDTSKHQFLHIGNVQCNDTYQQMFRHLVLHIIMEKGQITLPQYENSKVDMYLPEEVRSFESIDCKDNLYDAVIKYNESESVCKLGVFVDVEETIDKDKKTELQIEEIPSIEINLIQPYHRTPPLKFKELKDILLNTSKFSSWIFHPLYDQKVEQLIQNKETFLYNYAKNKEHHTKEGLLEFKKILHNYKPKYYSQEETKERLKKIRNDIRNKFVIKSPFYSKNKCILSEQQKYGLEEFFLLYLHIGINYFSWNPDRKQAMYDELYKEDNMPTINAIGSLWFGFIFNMFHTNDFQIFINILASKYPQTEHYVLTYINGSSFYKNYCKFHTISLLPLQDIGRNDSANIWIDGIFYTAFSAYDNQLFPKVTLPKIIHY